MLLTLNELASTDADTRLAELAHTFRRVATDAAFPCIFSHLPFTTSTAYFSLFRRRPGVGGAVHAELRSLLPILRTQPEAIAVLFVEGRDDEAATSLDDDLRLARSIVAEIRAEESRNHGPEVLDPSDPSWSLKIDGVEMFVNFSSPNHVVRTSRNVGPAFTVIAQARASFDRGGRAGLAAREEIRRRLAAYDGVQAHPCLGRYGAPGNREALQYFLGDGTAAHDVLEPPHD
ncbi:YqcI/YcgG family protein [Jatrophihabitans sp.]|uniref:YqcI/YcgG family protein n=1 Tax=Jatrophihabitans sp. TaxID=1932789 RepID=UPI002C6222F6|nr:YqcI/YcgG family protein [Jatrophihabitans sp.]